MAMTLNSPAFQQNGHFPSKYTCEGEDVSPPLAWEGVPNGAKSLVLIIDDPDAPDPKAPKMVWVHSRDRSLRCSERSMLRVTFRKALSIGLARVASFTYRNGTSGRRSSWEQR